MGSTCLGALIPCQPQPAKPVQDGGQRLVDIAALVGIVDPQNKLTSVAAGKQPIKKRGSNSTNVKVTCGAGGETRANSHRGGIGAEETSSVNILNKSRKPVLLAQRCVGRQIVQTRSTHLAKGYQPLK